MRRKFHARWKAPHRAVFAFAASFAMAALAPLGAAEAKLKVLYSFQGGNDGANPQASLITIENETDNTTYFYGTTFEGGPYGRGDIFRLASHGAETIPHTFQGGSDGAYPVANLIADKTGNLYGTTIEGGGTNCGGNGCGTVFELAPDGTETVLYAFRGGKKDGANPFDALLRDHAGNLYGTTRYGAGRGCQLNEGCGVVFKLTPGGAEKVLYAFKGGNDTGNPTGKLVRDKGGNLYGAGTWGGGAGNDGAIFKLAPEGVETVLYSFTPDAFSPTGLTADDAGNLYTTVQGGEHGHGAVFKLAANGMGGLLYSFKGGSDGDGAFSGVIVDAAGNLYGTTAFGGGTGCGGAGCGTVFKIAPDGSEVVLYSFTGGDDGDHPSAGLIADKKGNFYGTTPGGGTHDLGNVFKLSQ